MQSERASKASRTHSSEGMDGGNRCAIMDESGRAANSTGITVGAWQAEEGGWREQYERRQRRDSKPTTSAPQHVCIHCSAFSYAKKHAAFAGNDRMRHGANPL